MKFSSEFLTNCKWVSTPALFLFERFRIFVFYCIFPILIFFLSIFQVMETKNMIYLVSEYASQGEIFGKWISWYFPHTRQTLTFTLWRHYRRPFRTHVYYLCVCFLVQFLKFFLTYVQKTEKGTRGLTKEGSNKKGKIFHSQQYTNRLTE